MCDQYSRHVEKKPATLLPKAHPIGETTLHRYMKNSDFCRRKEMWCRVSTTCNPFGCPSSPLRSPLECKLLRCQMLHSLEKEKPRPELPSSLPLSISSFFNSSEFYLSRSYYIYFRMSLGFSRGKNGKNGTVLFIDKRWAIC